MRITCARKPVKAWAVIYEDGCTVLSTESEYAEDEVANGERGGWHPRLVELVEVVRCKNCARFDRGAYSTRELGSCSLMNDMVHEDSFCSFVVSKL